MQVIMLVQATGDGGVCDTLLVTNKSIVRKKNIKFNLISLGLHNHEKNESYHIFLLAHQHANHVFIFHRDIQVQHN